VSLLLVRDDGTQVASLKVGRRFAVGVLVLLPAALVTLGVVLGEQLDLRAATHEAAALRLQVDVHRAALERVERVAGDIRGEVTSWRQLHARIRDPFGPDAATPRAPSGIGGTAHALSLSVPVTEERAALVELDRTLASVREEGEKLRALDRLMAQAGRMLAALPSRWPLRGPVNSEFGSRVSPWGTAREFHNGVDIGAVSGTPVRAPAGGTVIQAGANGENGITVVVDHGQDVRTLYAHLSRVAVRNGQAVDRGAVLGFSGNTGRSTGPHLHYEVQVAGRAVDPRSFLWQ
jgi:murein DD-endopeptidase MepM/ murein hydrolase activator NlpD